MHLDILIREIELAADPHHCAMVLQKNMKSSFCKPKQFCAQATQVQTA